MVSIGLVFISVFFDFPPISIIPPMLRTHSLISVKPTLCNRSKWKSTNNTLESRSVPVFKETLRDGPRFEDRLCVCVCTDFASGNQVPPVAQQKTRSIEISVSFPHQSMWPYTSAGAIERPGDLGYKKLDVKGFGGRGGGDYYSGKWPSDLTSDFSRTNTAGLHKLPVIICVYVRTNSASGRFSFVKSTLGVGVVTDKMQ
jgi:hypothetical protein